MSLYTRARRHVDMNRVKELREEKIKRQKIAEVQKQQENILAELKKIEIKESSKYSNWRRGINEQMTTSDMGMINYPAVGDVNLGAAMSNISLSGDGGEHEYNAITRNSTSSYKQFDTMVVTLTTTSSDWVITPGKFVKILGEGGAGTYTVVIPASYSSLYFSAKDDGTFSASVQYRRRSPVNLVVPLDDPESSAFVRDGDFDRLSNEQKKKKLEEQLSSSEEYLNKMFGKGMPKGATTIADYEPQQSFVDNYHANKYGLPTNYKDKLGKAQAYFQNNLNKVGYRTLGFTEPERMDALYDKAFKKQGFTDKQIETIKKEKLLKVDYGRSPSFKAAEERAKRDAERAAAERQRQVRSYSQPFTGLSPSDLRSISNRTGGSYSGRTGRSSTQKPYMNIRVGDKPTTSTPRSTSNLGKDYGQIAQGPRGFDRPPGSYSPSNIIPIRSPGSRWRPGEGYDLKDPLKNIPFQGPGLSRGRGNQIAAAGNPRGTGGKSAGDPNNIQWPRNNPYKKPKPGPGYRPPTAQGRRTMVAHHEPQGEVIKEKKTFKDLTKKIPGYYDGKPSPLGFPVEEPPKMVNGYHPDLVDGKKVANRFNRLDPISARAMTKTGNPHIDKKVRAAAKKPK